MLEVFPRTSTSVLPCLPSGVDDFLSQPSAGVVATVAEAPGPFIVLGAGGKIGLHLSITLRRALDQLGRRDRVIAVSRFQSLHDASPFEQRGIHTHRCDLATPGAVSDLPDAPTVFFLAGVKFGTTAAPALLHTHNVEMPQRVAARYARSRIVAFSSGCVYPFVAPRSGGATEATEPAPIGDYAASCLAREQAFVDRAGSSGNPVALIRLNYANEFRYGLLVDIATMVRDGRAIDVTMGYVNVIWQADAIAYVIQALRIAGAPAVPLNVTGREILSVRDLAMKFGQILGRDPKLTGHEADTAWLNDASKSHALFGAPPTSIEQMIRWTAEWVARGEPTWGKPTGFERRDGSF